MLVLIPVSVLGPGPEGFNPSSQSRIVILKVVSVAADYIEAWFIKVC